MRKECFVRKYLDIGAALVLAPVLATGVGAVGVPSAKADGVPTAPSLRAGAPHRVLPRSPSRPLDTARLAAGINPTVGRLEYDNPDTPGKVGVCAAAAVRSDNRNLIVTAGHCMSKGGANLKYKNVKFWPGATQSDPAPFGVFEAFRSNAVRAWGVEGDERYDFGFVNLKPNYKGQRLGDVVGENGLSVNESYVAQRTVISYPVPLRIQKECFGETRPFLPAPESRVRINCDFPKGSSGGPWLKDYDASTRLGLINGVISHVARDASFNLSPYFDDAIWEQYQRSATY